MRIVETVVNISEGRDAQCLRTLVEAIKRVPQAYLLGCDEDYDHNRTVLTCAGDSRRRAGGSLGVVPARDPAHRREAPPGSASSSGGR